MWLFLLIFLTAALQAIPSDAAPLVSGSVTGNAIAAQVTGGPANPTDWVSLERVADGSIVTWRYLNGQQTVPPAQGLAAATVSFPLPPDGSYFFHLYANNGSKVLATSANFAVSATAKPPAGGVTSLKCVGAVNCSGTTGDVTITGTEVAGPTGPKGNMGRGIPLKGIPCDGLHNNGQDGDSFYDYDNPTTPTGYYIWTCSSNGKWYRNTTLIPIAPWK